VRDLRYAIRVLRRTPLFTVVAMATLAIGIGANTTVFTFVENILLRALPIHDPEQVDSLSWGDTANTSYPNYVDFRHRNTVFFRPGGVSLRCREPECTTAGKFSLRRSRPFELT
jgi:hypothetical protein